MITVRDLLEQKTDIDVYDDYDESLAIAFCGPMALTDEGEKEFGKALDLEVTIPYDVAIVHVNDDEELLDIAVRLFCSLAGYCTTDEYDRWFKEGQA